MKDSIAFLLSFANQPDKVGSMLPSSPFLAKAIAQVAKEYGHQQTIVEIGAGTGSLTSFIKRISEPTSVVAFEQNAHLAKRLIRNHPDVKVYDKSVPCREMNQLAQAGCVIVSSIPFRSLEREEHSMMATAMQELLRKNERNALIQYTYFPRQPFSLQGDSLKWRRRRLILANVPPAFIWTLAKA